MAFTLPIVRNYFPNNDFIAFPDKAYPDFIWPMKVNSVLI